MIIKENRKEFYEQQEPPFGDEVQNAFPKAGLDIAAASRCYALDEWTACVFHLMRVLEHSLKWLADDLGLPHDNKQWYTLINEIEKELKKLEQKGQSKRLTALSQAAIQFRYFKNAWRNHVAHARQNYDENSAQPVWISVKTFIQFLAQMALTSSASQPQP